MLLLQNHFLAFRRFLHFHLLLCLLELQLSVPEPAVNGDMSKHARHSWGLQLLPKEFRQVFKVHRVSSDSALAGPDDGVSRRFNVACTYCWAILRRAGVRLGDCAMFSLALIISSTVLWPTFLQLFPGLGPFAIKGSRKLSAHPVAGLWHPCCSPD